MIMLNNRLKELRAKFGYTQHDLAHKLNTSYGAVGNWESGKRTPDTETLIKMANIFNTTVDYLLGRTDDPINYDDSDLAADISPELLEHFGGDIKKALQAQGAIDEDALRERAEWYSKLTPFSKLERKRVPIVGSIACGKPIYAEEQYGEYVLSDVDADFALYCKGDSMVGARIHDGDLVFIRKQANVENGEIAAVVIDDDATLKRIYFYPAQQKLILSPENPSYEPLVFIGEELDSIHILGKAVAFQSLL